MMRYIQSWKLHHFLRRETRKRVEICLHNTSRKRYGRSSWFIRYNFVNYIYDLENYVRYLTSHFGSRDEENFYFNIDQLWLQFVYFTSF